MFKQYDRPTHCDFVPGSDKKEKNRIAYELGFTHVVDYVYNDKEFSYYCKSLGSALKCKEDIKPFSNQSVIKEIIKLI